MTQNQIPENILGKVRFQKKWEAMAPLAPFSSRGLIFFYNLFKKELLKFIKAEPTFTYNIHGTKDQNYLQNCGLYSVI